ncbi:helix-turn-helix domain-containing protein [Psychrobacter sp. I-STPA6b]|uniref:helix-turn-helix domain-containing protein n=1 Tax=Psychrobacter sp. I-STPA6b TaxID=2585718 RepID=UPI001D0C65CC|nr:helix-turn-helix domain-containing protein [Psychrobacter sp. I-STPA6b]
MTTTRQPLTPKQTQTAIIKAHLLSGQSISTWQAYQLYQITCLAQRIHDLRNAGMPIDSEIVIKDGKRFSLYWLAHSNAQAMQGVCTSNAQGVLEECPNNELQGA